MNINSFIISPNSLKPSLIIAESELQYLVTIDEFNGDYKWINKYVCDSINISPEEELSILSNYGQWFYNQHEDIFQEIILKNLYYYFNN
tara:strand:+ start:577 stop:843 length:267 start_codon:yes stop_codon:yes gene_type:complete